MTRKSIYEYFRAIYERYQKSSRFEKQNTLDEFCKATGYHRKYAIRKLNGAPPGKKAIVRKRKRGTTYGPRVISIIQSVWKASDYPCSIRLKEILSQWMPWIRERYGVDGNTEMQLLSISPRQMDRRLKDTKRTLKKQMYGRTKPGTLLKHMIPIKTDNWDVKCPGWTEVDTVAHCGNSLSGEFVYTVNQTDIHTTWVESRAVLGKGERGVLGALHEMREALPFQLQGIDSDNGSEFINWHLLKYCKHNRIQPFRGRPYKKDDNAHIEQKNWTHVRRIFGYMRLDTQEAVEAMNDLYRNELRLFMNLFMPSMKLQRKVRIGSRLKRVYGKPKTPFERLCTSQNIRTEKVSKLKGLRRSLNPFALSKIINEKLEKILEPSRRTHSTRSARKIQRQKSSFVQFGKGEQN